MEFTILDNGLKVEDGRVMYQWFKLADPAGRVLHRAVALRELTYLPIETRDDPDVLGKQWAALRGLYNADVDFCYTALGAFQPERLGVVQFYGAAHEAPSREEAAAEALRRLAAVEAVLANYPQSRTVFPDLARLELLIYRLQRLPRLLAILGHPDPRLARKGLGRDGAMGQADDELLSQQGENLLRGLARLREDFVFLVTAAHVGRPALTSALARMAQVASQIASRQRGNIGLGFSIAIPLATALAGSYAANAGRSDAVSHSHADTFNEGWGISEARSWGHSVGTTESHSVGQTESVAVTDGISVARTDSVSAGWSHTDSVARTDSGAHTDSWARTTSEANTVSEAHTTSQARTESGSHTDSWAHTTSRAETSSWAHTDSRAETGSWAHTSSSAQTVGQSASTAHSEGTSWGTTDSEASNWSEGTAHTQSTGHSSSVAATSSVSTGHTVSSSTGQTHSTSETHGTSASTTTTEGTSHSASDTVSGSIGGGVGIPGVANVNAEFGASHSEGTTTSHTTGTTSGTMQSTSSGVATSTSSGTASTTTASTGTTVATGTSSAVAETTSASTGGSVGHSVSQGGMQSTTTSTGTSTAHTTGTANTVGGAVTTGSADTRGGAVTTGTAETRGGADTRGWADTTGTAHTTGTARTTGTADTRGGADTRGWAVTRGSADGVSGSVGVADTVARSHSVTRGVATSETWGKAVSEGWSEGRSNGRSYNAGRGHGVGFSEGQAISYGAGRAFTGGLGAGIVPGVSLNRNWQTEDDLAIRLTEIARGLESLLNTASHEGGFLTTALLLTSDTGERAAQALAPQAFHGPNVPTPVLTVPGEPALRQHALAFRPSLAPDGDPFRVDVLWTRWGTLLTPAMLAAYTSPNVFEEGTAVTIQEKLPPLGFYPELKGEVVVGHQVSPETGDLTNVPLRLSRDRHFHTAFCGDTGYGKSVAAERMVYETTLHWGLKSIVLDFGTGWRKLLNAPGLAGHVEVRQLSPGGVRPLRWNPLQIGRHILPEVQWRAFADIFGTIGQLGGKRQVHELREILRKVYLAAGVLVDDPECRNDPAWGSVRPLEAAQIGVAAGMPLAALDRMTRQRLAVLRSQQVGLADLHRRIETELTTVPPKDIRRSILEGIAFRLKPLVQGEAGAQYAAGPDAIDINEVVPGDWGVAVLEGGAFLDDFSKAFLLGWAAWQLYTDAVVLRVRNYTDGPARMQIVFEEANKILAGLDKTDEEGGLSTAEQFANMWRDSRKYGIWLHLITQSPSLIPPGILTSCNNLITVQLKGQADQDAIITALARSPKGLVDEPWRRFLASLPVGRAVARLGYTTERAYLEPVYVQPLLLNLREPSDEEIAAVLG